MDVKKDCEDEEKPVNTDANTSVSTKEKPANTNANAKLKRENITDVSIKEKHVVVNYHNSQLCFTIKNIIDYTKKSYLKKLKITNR